MVVGAAGEELFVNAAWTTEKKVPAKSPYGVELTWGENVFRLGDKVIQTKNDYRLSWERERRTRPPPIRLRS